MGAEGSSHSPSRRGTANERETRRVKLRQWKAGMDEMNRLELEEKRRRTPAERLRLLSGVP